MLLLAMLVIVLALCKQFLPASQASVGGALENALAKRRPRAPCAPAQARGACDPCGTKLNEPIALRLARGDAVDHAALKRFAQS